jgi:hypothetical protein
MAIPNPVTYADITAKIAEVDNDLVAYNARQGAFVASLNDWIHYFIYNLQDVQVAAAIAAAADAGEIDPAQGQAIYRKFLEVQEALRRANSDADKIAIFDNLRQFEPVLRKLPLGDAQYNGLPDQPPAPPNYPVGPLPLPIAGGPDFPDVPAGPPVRQPAILDPSDASRANEIAAAIDSEPDATKRPLVRTSTGREGRATDVYRDPVTGEVLGFEVTIPPNGMGLSRRINVRGGKRSRRNRKSKKRGGYKSRKSRRRTFR